MESQSVDYVELLKKAEDEAAGQVESARLEAAARLKRAHERASAIFDDSGKNAAGRKHQMMLDARVRSQAEAEAILRKGQEDAQALSRMHVDAGVVSKCLGEFLEGLDV
jgi:vacuolar-type H+-ATPase subunit H